MVSTAYNDWLSGYCAADPDRLFGAAMLPMQDPGGRSPGVAEGGRRARDSRRHSSDPIRAWGARCRTPAYEPVWSVAEELGVPDRHPRGEFGDRAHPGLGPALQSADPARRLAFVRGDAGLRAAHGLRDPRSSSRSAASCSWSRVAAGCPSGSNASTSSSRTSADSARRCRCAPASTSPASAPSASRSTRPPCRLCCRSSATTGWSGDRTIPTTTPPSPARWRPSVAPWSRSESTPRRASSGPTPGASTGCPHDGADRPRWPPTTSWPSPCATPPPSAGLFAHDAVLDAEGTVYRGSGRHRPLLRRGGVPVSGICSPVPVRSG